MKQFDQHELHEAIVFAKDGGQALHCHTMLMSNSAPQCFVRDVKAGKQIGHLFDQNEARLIATARQLGVKIIVIDRKGQLSQHIDLCGQPMNRALAVTGQLNKLQGELDLSA